MKIAIIGAGSMGLLFGGYLGKENMITMLARRQEQSELLAQKGIIVNSEKDCFHTNVISDPFGHSLNEQDLIIISVKQYHLSQILPILNNIPYTIPVLFLQNGMGHINLLKELKNETIAVGTVEHGALKTSENTVKHTGIGQTNIALFRGEKSKVNTLINLDIPYFPINFQVKWEDMLVKKLLINAMINPLTAILNVRNGDLISNSHYLSLLNTYFNEVFRVFSFMDKQMIYGEIVKVCRNTSENKSSMLMDIFHKRRTEVDAILGYILERAKTEKIQVPITNALFQMVKGMEEERGE
ncbi:2-dehydropantoate 2-reductase [Bacillus sp. FJAT-49736]|uniref:2-dehydropantoate 2-reductase n=1 Tax=Bacillus sp. FJAT-49736 TaxID=2833582 RepID=UPI001BC92BEB|nr:2-dehydropantoate 2-reductase [Bacillus sp. FJAT-49736]MBS4172414.1 2-dehydropantoate 2-reductase [Bacillus sp. FJAT-49736]